MPTVQIEPQVLGGSRVDRHEPRLAELGVADFQMRRVEIQMNVTQGQTQCFSNAKPRAGEQADQGFEGDLFQASGLLQCPSRLLHAHNLLIGVKVWPRPPFLSKQSRHRNLGVRQKRF